MAPESRFFRASFPTALLPSAALAIALIVQASPARSEMIDLTCASTGEGGGAMRLLVDTDRSTGTEIRVVGLGPFKSDPYAATISAQFIKYEGRFPGNQNYDYTATLDRIAGTLISGRFGHPQTYACRRATQKF